MGRVDILRKAVGRGGAVGGGKWAVGFGMWVMGFGMRVMGFGMWVMGFWDVGYGFGI